MKRITMIAAVAAASMVSMPAMAAQFFEGTTSGLSNVYLAKNGSTTNHTGTITGGQVIKFTSNVKTETDGGYRDIEEDDKKWTNLDINFADHNYGFNAINFGVDFEGDVKSTFTVEVFFFGGLNPVTFNSISFKGDKNFSLTAGTGEVFSKIVLKTNAQKGFDEIGKFDIGMVSAPGAVPEPATWALMIGGFGLVGASMRRRSTKVQFA